MTRPKHKQTYQLSLAIFLLIASIKARSQDYTQIRQLTSLGGTAWTPTTAPLSSFPINDVLYASGQWIAVGDGATILKSRDGIDWNRSFPIGEIAFRSVSFRDGLWLISGEHGTILYSSDATTWYLAETPLKIGTIQEIKYGNGQWKARLEHRFLNSSDGKHWSLSTPSVEIDQSLADFEFGNGRWLALTYDALYASDDGEIWQAINLDRLLLERFPAQGDDENPFPGEFDSLKFANGRWTMVGHSPHILTSEDGLEWAFVSLPTLPPDAEFSLVDHHQGSWIIAGVKTIGRFIFFSDEPLPYYLTSKDGVTWSIQNLATPIPFDHRGITAIAASESRWVAAHPEGLLSSPDSLSWEKVEHRPSIYEELNPVDLHFANDRWVMGGYGGIAVSGDGFHWDRVPLPTEYPVDHIHYADGRWVATARHNLLIAETDPTTWSRLPVTIPDRGGIGYGNGKWVLTGGRPQLLISENLLEWKSIELSAPENLHDVHFAQDQWVAVGGLKPVQFAENGRPTGWDNLDFIVHSLDADNWNIVFEGRLSAVAFDAIGFAANIWLVGAGGMVSTNGTDWTRTAPMHGLTKSATYGDGRWIGVSGNRVSIWNGPGTKQLKQAPSVRSLELAAVAFGQGRFLAVGPRQYLQHTVISDQPSLHLEFVDERIKLSWPIAFWNYQLYAAPSLDGTYTLITDTPGIEATSFSVDLPLFNSLGQFFRLQSLD